MKNRKINSSLKRKIKKQSSSYSIISQKIKKYQEIIQNTILYIQKYKTLDIIDAGDLNICIQNMENLYESCKNILLLIKDKSNVDINDVANRLQIINNELSINFKSYGTGNLKNLLDICITIIIQWSGIPLKWFKWMGKTQTQYQQELRV